MTKKFLIPIALLFFGMFSKAQEIIALPFAKPLSKFKFEQLNGGVILLRATLDNHKDSLNFIFDTGSGGISLDSNTAVEFNLLSVHSDKTIRGIGGIRPVDFAMHHTLHLPGITADSLDFHINNYSLLDGIYGIKIDGIIGYSLLRRYIIQIDYDSQTLKFFSPGAFKYNRGGTLLHPAFNSLPIQSADIKELRDIRHRFYLDTGGGLCLLLSKDFTLDSTIFPKKKKMVETVAEGLGGKKAMQITTIKEMKLGPYKFKKVPTYIFDDEYNVTSYPSLGGLIGADLLRHFNITLNYPKAEIHILPNSHFHDPFDYSYTGMELYIDEGKVLIGDVMKNSPAEKAGLKSDDEVFSIDGRIGINFTAMKSLLQNAGKKVKLIVFRGGKPLEIRMKIERVD
jgi:hypothetical protein